ncbi:hypothetical protein V2J09_019338 [Rumex salicifolius]
MGACMSNQAHEARLKRARERHQRGHERQLSHHNAARNKSVVDEVSPGIIREKYAFGKELGRGEFGVTYLVTRVEGGESYACKTISKGKLKTEVELEDVRREVEIMRQLPKHPNIVEYKEVYEDKDAVYLVMELCQGGELFDRVVARGHYSERAASQVAKTILTVVQVCHEHGVIHRDLKPENFLYSNVDEDSPLKAIDFGLSIFFEEGQRFSEVVGSPYYMAPEVLKRDYGSEVDIWISPEAKDLVERMLDQNPYNRLTLQEVLEHPWLQNTAKAPDVSLGSNTLFDEMDTDRNGKLSFDELKAGFVMLGQPLSDSDVQTILDAVTMSIHIKRLGTDEHLLDAFKYFDKNQSGYIELDELKEALSENDIDPINDQVIHNIVLEVDLDKDGRISYKEFKAAMSMGTDWKMASRQYSKAMLNALSFKMFVNRSMQLHV